MILVTLFWILVFCILVYLEVFRKWKGQWVRGCSICKNVYSWGAITKGLDGNLEYVGGVYLRKKLSGEMLCMGTATNTTPESVTLLPVTLLKSIESPEAVQHAGKQDWWNLCDHDGKLKHQSPLLGIKQPVFQSKCRLPSPLPTLYYLHIVLPKPHW